MNNRTKDKKPTKDIEDVDPTLDDGSDDAADRDEHGFTLEMALKDARQTPGFKQAVFGASDAARAAATVAILKYADEAAEVLEEWDLEERFHITRYHYRWALRGAASRKFLRTIHKRFPFSEVGDPGDES